MKRAIILGVLVLLVIVSFVSAEDYDISCETDDDCRIINNERITACCGSCQQDDYASDNLVGINREWVNEQRNCSVPVICPDCVTPVAFNSDKYDAKCLDNECIKSEISTNCYQYSVPATEFCLDGNLTREEVDEKGCLGRYICLREREEECLANWQCTEWGECQSDLTQIRTCLDANKCGIDDKPFLWQDCEILDDCEPIGLRRNGNYCSFDKIWVEQKEKESVCENNFECDSNVCVDDECISGTFIQKILNWLKKVFTRE